MFRTTAHRPKTCYHGGAFFDAIGPDFDQLDKRNEVINADVLDAWFDPSPRVTDALTGHLPWLIRTSPPAGCEGMIRAVAKARGLPVECVLPGAGSSDLIFLAFRHWLTPRSRVLILDPMYGEYAHVLEKVMGCRVDRFHVNRKGDYEVNLDALESVVNRSYDMIVLVNPNSPTGRHIPRRAMEHLVQKIPSETLVWIDETYIEYAGPDESLERFAIARANVVICKSMSKVYALSGLRSAYLAASSAIVSDLKGITPPWAVSLPSQVASVAALQDPVYYASRYAETHLFRQALAAQLIRECRLDVVPGVANFLLCHLPESGPAAATIVQTCRQSGLFLRDAEPMGQRLGPHAIRIAVKDRATNHRMAKILTSFVAGLNPTTESPRLGAAR